METGTDENGGKQHRKSSTTIELKGNQQPLEKMEERAPPDIQDIAPTTDQNTLEKNGDKKSKKPKSQRSRHTKRNGIQHEGLVYKRKKVIIKHDRGLIAWMKAGKSGRVKLEAGN